MILNSDRWMAGGWGSSHRAEKKVRSVSEWQGKIVII